MGVKNVLKNKLSPIQWKWVTNCIRYFKTIGRTSNLTHLAKVYSTDKWGEHYYTPHYQLHFQPFKYKNINLLEIGVGGYDDPLKGGASLRMWKRYFPFAKIFSLDIFDKSFHEENRIKIYNGSQVDQQFLNSIVDKCKKFDLIIDDGSHINKHVIQSFEYLFPFLSNEGIYVIEDTQTSYWPEFGGDSIDLNNSTSLMTYFKKFTDGLNYMEYKNIEYSPSYFELNIISIHFYHNLIFIYKGPNNEKSNKMKEHTTSNQVL